MIERKTYRADIDRQRPKIFLVALLISVSLFFIALNWRSHDFVSDILENLDEEPSFDLEMLAALEPEKNVIAAKVEQKPEVTERINKVDEVKEEQELKELKEKLEFKTSEADGADELKTSEVEPIAPPVTDMNNNELPMRIVEELPEFPGGMTEFMKWMTAALKYPQRARQSKQQGMVAVTFVVEKDGSATNIKFTKQTHTSLDAEVLRVLHIMPKWKPGKHHGKACRTVVGLPIVFAL